MTDEKMIELAAKAVGINLADRQPVLARDGKSYLPPVLGRWNPLENDGDALRLVVKLRLVVHVWDEGDTASAAKTEPNGDDPELSGDAWFAEDAHACNGIESATRRAIVRAAAAIQQAKEAQ